QIRDLEATINSCGCDLVLFSTPIHLNRLLSLDKPAIRVRYEYADYGEHTLQEVLEKRMAACPRFS
ncbi:MAG: GTPase, partial [Deltaproteobacteria bacterium]|nr:GTPase [Deltaproteobacteria bacterium]